MESDRFVFPALLLDRERLNDVSVCDNWSTCGFKIYRIQKIIPLAIYSFCTKVTNAIGIIGKFQAAH
jgi:hypothetical protein